MNISSGNTGKSGEKIAGFNYFPLFGNISSGLFQFDPRSLNYVNSNVLAYRTFQRFLCVKLGLRFCRCLICNALLVRGSRYTHRRCSVNSLPQGRESNRILPRYLVKRDIGLVLRIFCDKDTLIQIVGSVITFIGRGFSI